MKIPVTTIKNTEFAIKNFARRIDIENNHMICGNIEGLQKDKASWRDYYPDVVADFWGRSNELIFSLENTRDFSNTFFSGRSSFCIDFSEIPTGCEIDKVKQVVLYITYRKYSTSALLPLEHRFDQNNAFV